ncbi:DUF4440 domain-containing protein [Candidatus Poribacteria bacterium]|nr:DUF4440 domain-containing protein [Candidatus Poribacteria bacterium]MBT5536608.1 DUF4440 domain-containing protein [Candidatus Poribacteria bacterium]MBT7096024.1 DUF4440 domain-containing protein [Candidatus Poribacteria bacterium]MBT7808049.1 DUF4440 domain-containing protein [Candidatus Poribacteria bacterium]
MRQAFSRLSKTELVQALHEEPNINGANLSDVDLAGVNLARCNLSGARFNGADLAGSYLQGVLGRWASFVEAKMQGAAMPAAALEGAGFRAADMRSVNLSWADLREASFVGARLSDAQLHNATMTGAALTDADLEGARLDNADLDNAVLQRAQLSNAVLHGATLRHADLFEADLRRVDLRGADLSDANLVGAQLGGAKYDEETVFPDFFNKDGLGMYLLGPDADLQRMDIDGFEFRGQDLSRANMGYANLVGADLRGADLSEANLEGARLRNALYDDETRFPNGFEPDLRGGYAVIPGTVIRFAKMQWKHLRDAALSGASLVGADLTGADLTGAELNSADLTRATLYCANLTEASLHGATLREANGRGAMFMGADMRRADMRGANFSWADFAETDLRGAKLSGAVLEDARLRGARYNDATVFPPTFDPVAARMMGGDGGSAARVRPPRVTEVPEPASQPLTLARREVRRHRNAVVALAERGRTRVLSNASAAALTGVIAKVLSSQVTWLVASGVATLAVVLWSGEIQLSRRGDVADLASEPVEMSTASLLSGAMPIRGSLPILIPALHPKPPAADIAQVVVTPPTPPVAVVAPLAVNAPAHAAETVEVEEALLARAVSIRGSAPIVVPDESFFARASRHANMATPTVAAAPAHVHEVASAAPVTAVDAPVAVASAVTAPGPTVATLPVATKVTAAPRIAGPTTEVTPDTTPPPAAAEAVAAAQMPDAATEPAADRTAALSVVEEAPVAVGEAVAPVSASPAARPAAESVAAEAPPADITAAVERWRTAWEGRDADAYADLYHPEASAPRGRVGNRSLRAPRFTKVSLQARATNLFSQYDRIQVDVGAMAVRRDGDLFVSTFDQDFTAWRATSDASPAYVDHGRRTLVFARDRGSEWRIVSDQWRQVTQ